MGCGPPHELSLALAGLTCGLEGEQKAWLAEKADGVRWGEMMEGWCQAFMFLLSLTTRR
jgi:hypothetical protein